MEDNLRALLTRLRKDSDLAVSVEEATRQAAVLPILSSLGWDWQNLREVVPEFTVGQGRVDYCLKQGDRNAVFVEVKRTGEPLEAHQEQLLGYAFREGVKLAVLTDGLAWWLYLPTQAGSWDQRKFFTIDVERQDPETAASHFRQFLQREAVFDGTALASAESVLRGHERSRAIEHAMPRAWDQLRTGPDELLVELLSDAVEGLSGHRPEDEDVAQFLARAGLTPDAVGTEPLRPAPTPAPAQDQGQGTTLDAKSYTGTTPVSYSLFGERHDVSIYRDVLSGVCEAMYAAHAEGFLDSIFRLRGSKRPYFSKDPNVLRAPKAILDTGVYAEMWLSANDIVRRCRSVLSLFGHDPADLTIEVQSN